jgi:hypothetical protein
MLNGKGTACLSEDDELEKLNWIACDDTFIEADVIRFQESVWERKGPRGRTRSVRIGEREVTAEVLKDDPDREGWVYLKVLKCAVLKTFKPHRRSLQEGEEIKRKRRNVLRKGVLRLPWSDESARAVVVQEWKAGWRRDRKDD